MQRLLHQALPLANGGSDTSADCHHGLWNATTSTCDCAVGWTTDWTNQDILGGNIVYCNSQASTSAPGNTTAATTKASSSVNTVLIIVVVVAAVVVVVLGVLCFCCCRRRRNMEAQQRMQQQQDAAEQQAQQQRHLEELKQRQREDEAEWNREALLRRQMWDSQSQWHFPSYTAMGELWSGSPTSVAAATTNSQFQSQPIPLIASTPATPRRSREMVEFPAFTEPYAMVPSASPSVRYYRTAPTELSSNMYDSDSSARTTTSDECIYTQYSESPPPALPTPSMAKGTSPFTTPRHVELYDPNNPF